MMLTDSCSLTPPVSPANFAKDECMPQPKEFHSLARIPCFSCKGSSFVELTKNQENYLDGGHFQKFLKKEILFQTSCTTVLLFNKPFSTDSMLLEDRRKLFACAKKQFQAIKILLNSSNCLQISEEEIPRIRLQICSFLAFIKNFLIKLSVTTSETKKRDISSMQFSQLRSCLSQMITELKEMLFFVGRLHSIQNTMMSASLSHNRRNSVASYHYYHVCLDLWWSVLACLHIIHDICHSMSVDLHSDVFHVLIDSSKTCFNQVADMIMVDLSSLALNTFKGSALNSEFSSPFSCTCINQLWIQILVILDRRHETYCEKPFWLRLFNLFQHAIQNANGVDENLSPESNGLQDYFSFENYQLKHENICEFFLWLTCHISPLYKHCMLENYTFTKELKSCYLIPKYLIEHILNDDYNTKNELILRKMLIHFLTLSKIWEPKGDVLLPLTDFYIKKIDDVFAKSKLEIQSVSYIFKSSRTWLDWLKNVTSGCSVASTTETSFQIYLRILATQLTKSSLNGSLWRQLKGRILSKFTPKRIKELTEAGLQNCFSVFLTIALCTNVKEVAPKMCDFSDLMQAIQGNIKREMVAWKALFVLLYIHQEQGQDLETVASKAVGLFNKCCAKYAVSLKDTMGQNNMMHLLLVYVENIAKIFENSTSLKMSEYVLIGSGFASILPVCTNELSFLLNILLNIMFCTLTKIKVINELYDETHFALLVKNLLEHVFPFIQSFATTNTAPLQLADLAVAFTCLATECSVPVANIISQTPVSLFKYFANAQNVNSAISVHYLEIILFDHHVHVGQKSVNIEDFHVVENLKCNIPDFHIVLMQAWIKCSICIPPPSIQAQNLTKYVFKLPEVESVFMNIQHIEVPGSLHDFLSIRFFKIMGEMYQNCSIYEKKKLKEQVQLYFSNIASIISLQMEQTPSMVFIDHVYKLIGHLVEYCAPLLYIKTSYSILQKLIDIMLLPHKTFPKDKFLPTILAKPIKHNFTLFITGILKLDYRNEPYVRRILKEIIDYYLDNFAVMNTDNPLISIYVSTASIAPHDENVFHFLVDILKEILSSNLQSTTRFKFFTEVFKNVSVVKKKEACEILMFDLLMHKFESTVPPAHENLMRILFCFLRKDTEPSYQKHVLNPLCNKVLKQLAWSQFKVFRFFEYVGKYCTDVIMEFIPCISKEIECIESKRGSGIEIALRKELKTLIDRIANNKYANNSVS